MSEHVGNYKQKLPKRLTNPEVAYIKDKKLAIAHVGKGANLWSSMYGSYYTMKIKNLGWVKISTSFGSNYFTEEGVRELLRGGTVKIRVKGTEEATIMFVAQGYSPKAQNHKYQGYFKFI